MCSKLNLELLNAVTVSRFALIAGEGARAPSISLSLSAIPLFGKPASHGSPTSKIDLAVSDQSRYIYPEVSNRINLIVRQVDHKLLVLRAQERRSTVIQ